MVYSLFLKVSGILYSKNEVPQTTVHYYVTQIHALSPWIRIITSLVLMFIYTGHN